MNTSSEKNIISIALEDLIQKFDEEKERLSEEVTQSMKNGEYDTATATIQFAQRLLEFQAEIEILTEKWEDIGGFTGTVTRQVKDALNSKISKKSPGRAIRTRPDFPKGMNTTTTCCFHILEVKI
jgi:hypothetical protein